MKPTVAAAYRIAMSESRAARERGDLDAAFAALERAHVLGQRHLVPHFVTHLHMLRIGKQRRDAREIAGQLLRLFATLPGWLTGWVPKGNTGGANVSAIRPMPLDGQTAELLRDFHVWRDVAGRIALYGVAAIAAHVT